MRGLRISSVLLRLGLAAGLVGVLAAQDSGCGAFPDPQGSQCKAAADCEGLPHVQCDGGWTCDLGACIWKCGDVPPVQECKVASDCEGKAPDLDCEGAWQCLGGTCIWNCVGLPEPECIATGCSGEVCAEEPVATDCVWLDWYECLRLTTCGRLANGTCGFEQNQAFRDCLGGTKPECIADSECPMGHLCTDGVCIPDTVDKKCVRTGCSGEICASEPMMSTCVWLDWYECLSLTTCRMQADGRCGFDQTEAFLDCLNGTSIGCVADSDCREGLSCINGVCVKPDECVTDADCARGEHCDHSPWADMPGCCVPLDQNGAGCPPDYPVCPGVCVPDDAKCVAVQPGTHGQCKMLLGWIWDGKQCVSEGGCSCEPDCRAFFDSLDKCQAACGAVVACSDDAACARGEICVNGVCMPSEPACVTDSDCVRGDLCINGICIGTSPACRQDTDCIDGEACTGFICVLVQGRCWADSDCGDSETCEGARKCPPGALCILADQAGTCTPLGDTCRVDSDCKAGAYCKWMCGNGLCTGVCEPLPEGVCVKDSDCKAGGKCVTGYCPLCVGCPCFGTCEYPNDTCKAVRPGTHGMCDMVLGVIFDGRNCVTESGCSCEPDCDSFFRDYESCRKSCM
jgi:eight-cysteine-cluster-containing protein